ncbi:UNVERIFIED_CONTAM: hypothetical protein K2H54_064534 [Gekko kuhli]
MRASKNRASVLGARHCPHLPSFGPAPSLKCPDAVQCLGHGSCCVPAAFLSAQRLRRRRTQHGGRASSATVTPAAASPARRAVRGTRLRSRARPGSPAVVGAAGNSGGPSPCGRR